MASAAKGGGTKTTDTSALNAWGRRNYLFSDGPGAAAATPRLVPRTDGYNRWRNNLVLNRNYWGVRDGNGNCLRTDDGASWFVAFDAGTMDPEPVLRIQLPQRVPVGFHGLFVTEDELRTQLPAQCGDLA